MTDPNGASVKAAYPGMAVTVSGWKELPGAGDEVLQGTEANVKRALGNRVRKLEIEEELRDAEAINVRRQQEREERLREMSEPGSSGDVAVEDAAQGVEDERKELRLVVKADVSGSVEAVVGAMEGVRSKKATVKVISTGVGPVTESDVMMAKAVDGTPPLVLPDERAYIDVFAPAGMVVAFSVDAPRAVETIAAQNHVLVYSSSIIYRIMDEIKARLIALLPVIVEKKVTGEATVLQLFDIHLKGKKIKKIAGCRIANGLAEKAKGARIVRAGEIVHEGTYFSSFPCMPDSLLIRARSSLQASWTLYDI
jgi:translation initiation factor IF-2